MATYRWKGRQANGTQVQGELVGRSKEEVVARLRGQQILVTTISEEQGGGEPPDPDLAIASVARTPRPRRFRSLVIVLAFLLGASIVGYIAPIEHFACERALNGRVDCVITERLFGSYPLKWQELVGVTRVEIAHDRSVARVVLANSSGASIRSGRDSHALGNRTEAIANDLSAFLSTSTPRITRWQGEWVPLLIAALLLLLGAAMFAAIVLSLFQGPRDWAEAKVKRRGYHPVAEIRPLSERTGVRPFGLAKGEFVVPDDFDAPLPGDVLDEFDGK